MSIVEQIEKLSVVVEDNSNYSSLLKSLELYHQMVESGLLKPRNNQVQSIYVPIEFNSNYN